MKMSCQSRAQAEKYGMNEINGVGIVAKHVE